MIIYTDTSAVLKLLINEAGPSDLAESLTTAAAALPGPVRSANAIHSATAIRLQVDTLVAYDAELLAAAAEAGLQTWSPRTRVNQ